MQSQKPSRWKRLLRHRPAYGGLIPPEAQVDPNLFPDDRYPVWCPDCDYLLRGLPDGRCPECGRSFEKGRLLVEQYVIEQGRRNWKRTSRWAKWTLVIGIALYFIAKVPLILMWLLSEQEKLNVQITRFLFELMPLVLGMQAIGVLFFLISMVVSIILDSRTRKKCKQVFDAIDRSTPTFQRANHYGRILMIAFFVLMAAWFGWSIATDDDWHRYYGKHPFQFVMAVFAATIVGCVALLGSQLRKRWFRS